MRKDHENMSGCKSEVSPRSKGCIVLRSSKTSAFESSVGYGIDQAMLNRDPRGGGFLCVYMHIHGYTGVHACVGARGQQSEVDNNIFVCHSQPYSLKQGPH